MDIVAPSGDMPALAGMSTQALREELARALTLSARTLQRLALIWRELEQRGEDLTDLRTGLASYLPLIAAGQLDAEVVVRFAGNKTLLNSISRLPVAEQHRLATGGTVEVVGVTADGAEIIQAVPAHTLTAAQARVVFAAGWIRPPEEQRIIQAARTPRDRLAPRVSNSDIAAIADRRRGTIKVGRRHVTPGELLAALVDLMPPLADDEERDKGVVIKLSDDEHRRLRIAAAEAGTSADRLIRLAMHNAGLI